jgi:uncharacterized protein (TIRG00374 family)
MPESRPLSPANSSRGKTLRLVVSLVLMAAALWFLWRTGHKAGWLNLARRLQEASIPVLLAAAGVNLVRYGVWGVRWKVVMGPAIRVPWWPAQRALMASVFFNTVIPGARPFGGLIRARYLSRSTGLASGPLYGGAVVDQLGYSLVSMGLGLVILPGAFWSSRTGGGGDRWFLAPALVVLGAVFFLAWRRREQLLERMRGRMPRATDALVGTFRTARKLLARPAVWMVMAAGGSAVWLGNVFTFQLASAALGAEIPLAAAAAAFSLGSLAGVASGTPGGAGTTEAAAYLPLVALGVPEDLALASVLLARGLHYASAVLLGGLCALAGRETWGS